MAAVSSRYPTATAGYSGERMYELAKPKKVPPAFLEDRRSVYWVDKPPPTGPTVFALTPRQEELVKSKRYHTAFIPDRPTPIWLVSRDALLALPSKRIKELSKPKEFNRPWIAMNSLYSHVSHSALHAAASARLEMLAQPKTYVPLPIKSNSEWDWGEWATTIPKTAKNHVASARLEQLAEPRQHTERYMSNRSTVWSVTRTAMHMQATTRLQQLARPKTRQALDQDYDPYKVSFAAKIAVPSPRVEDLAVPIPRKVRTKKAA